MKIRKKLINILYAFCASALLFAVAALPAALLPQEAYALSSTIWESTEQSVVTRGVTLDRVRRFTVDGWLNFDVMRIDLTDDKLRLDALYDSASIRELTTVKELAGRAGAVAAINGGFFEWNQGWGGSATGTVMKEGRIDSAFSETNAFGEVMGSITVNKLNQVLIDYCQPTIALKAGNAPEVYVGSYNKKSFYEYRDISILDRKWVKDSVGATKSMPDVVEMVAENGAVREVRVGMPPVEIPVNGFVAVTRAKEDGSHAFEGGAFSIGSDVAFTVTLNPALRDATMHVEGASMLVRDGVIPEAFSYEPGIIAQRNPRTMVGCNQAGDELLLVAVDGRRGSSFGLTSYESAELMYSLGAYDALNMDGGGSTTMVSRRPGTNNLELVNTVSDSSERAVINGIGVFTDAPRAAIRGIIIDVSDPNVFVGTHRQFSVRAYDRYYNPVIISGGDVVWSLSGVRGDIKDGTLVPGAAGNGVVRAKVGRATATVDVKVLSTPAELILNSTSLTMKPGGTHAFAVVGRDRTGFSARINPDDVTWTASDSFGVIERGVFKRDNDTAGYIAAAYGNAVAYCAVQPLPKQQAQAGQSNQSSQSGQTGQPAPSPTPVKLPPATRIADEANRAVDFTPSGAADIFRFGVLGDFLAPSPTPAPSPTAGSVTQTTNAAQASNPAKAVGEAFAAVANASLDACAYVGYGGHIGAGSIDKPVYATDGYFEVNKSFCGDSTRAFVKLSSAGDGLRVAGSEQWGSFLTVLNEFKGRDLFIVLHQGPSTFDDKQEAGLFKQTLADYTRDSGVRVWVFYAGPTDSVWIEDGVRYFSCAGASSSAADRATGAGAKYVQLTVRGDEVTYEYKPLL